MVFYVYMRPRERMWVGTIITKERIIIINLYNKKKNLIGENVWWVWNVRMSEEGMYHEILINISILYLNMVCIRFR